MLVDSVQAKSISIAGTAVHLTFYITQTHPVILTVVFN